MSKRKNVLYYTLGNGYYIDIIENTINNRLDFFVYSEDYPELKIQYSGPNGNLRQNFKTLENTIKQVSQQMIKEYHKEPYIRNKCSKPLPVIIDESQISLKKNFNNIFFNELNDGYTVEVEELQNFQNGTMIRNYFICDNTQSYKYKIFSSEDNLASFTPMDELIDSKNKEWINDLNKIVLDAICDELTNIESYIDETIIDNFKFKMFKYKDGTYCLHSNDGDIDMFYKHDNISNAYFDMFTKVNEQLSKIYSQTIEINIRKRLNRCRQHIASGNDIMFVSEMSIIKGLLYTYNKNTIDISKIIPEEIYINTFITKYENLTNDKFLNLNIQ